MDSSENQKTDAQRTRRNIAKMGAIGVAALLAGFAEVEACNGPAAAAVLPEGHENSH